MKRLLGAVCAFLLLVALGGAAQAADVAVLNSQRTADWYTEVGWDYEADMDVLRSTLQAGGFSFTEISVEDLEAGNLGDAKVLILPNTRRMSPAEVAAVQEFLGRGGRLLALGQTSFRDDKNQKVRDESYQLADEIGIAYVAWFGAAPKHAYARVVAKDHPIFAGLPEFIRFPRYWAMVNTVRGGAKILAEWYDEDQLTPSQAVPENNGAIIEGPAGNVIYIGDMIFTPGGADQPELQQLAINIIKYLLSK
ncbi:MAG: hypothetical protein IMX00_04885 [Limnochordales bacterium]|nr:hypothetical protein [Limnochordales bacterium]